MNEKMTKTKEYEKSDLELLAVKVENLSNCLASLRQIIRTLDNDRRDQWKIIKDICDKLEIKLKDE